jgi:hypothetical protein
VLTGLTLPLVLSAPAFAYDDGEAVVHTGWVYILLVYVCIPVGFAVVVAALVFGPTLRRRPRYRPTRDWQAEAIWFNGPVDPEQAMAKVSDVLVKGGGASAEW